jgi:hypothetical protein
MRVLSLRNFSGGRTKGQELRHYEEGKVYDVPDEIVSKMPIGCFTKAKEAAKEAAK